MPPLDVACYCHGLHDAAGNAHATTTAGAPQPYREYAGRDRAMTGAESMSVVTMSWIAAVNRVMDRALRARGDEHAKNTIYSADPGRRLRQAVRVPECFCLASRSISTGLTSCLIWTRAGTSRRKRKVARGGAGGVHCVRYRAHGEGQETKTYRGGREVGVLIGALPYAGARFPPCAISALGVPTEYGRMPGRIARCLCDRQECSDLRG